MRNCNDNKRIMKEALEKIERDSMFKPTCCAIVGPTGPTGPAGPATITVGTTTTGLPGTEASVTNSGTSENVILDFVIPEGEIGPTGPTGPTGTIAALDSILVADDTIQAVAAGNNIGLGDIINQTGDSMIYTAPDTVSLEPGTYIILFSALVSNTTTAGDIGASLEIDGTIVPSASEYVAASATPVSIVLQHNLTVDGPGTSLITVSNESTVSNSYHDANLSSLKIG